MNFKARTEEMKYYLALADKFVKSKAFPNVSPEQAFTIIKAGEEMGLKPMESMNSLYIVNGSINYHSKGLVARITKHGYKLEYLDETENGVTVHCYNDQGFDIYEQVKADDQVLQHSKVMKFAKKHKMRFHGVRMIANFHLPHLFGSVGGWPSDDYPSLEVIHDIPTLSHLGYAESLLETAKVSEAQYNDIAQKLDFNKVTTQELNQIIKVLQNAQPSELEEFIETGTTTITKLDKVISETVDNPKK